MKRQFFLMIFFALFSMVAVNAQGGGGQTQTPEERTKATMEKLAIFSLDSAAKTSTEKVIADFNNTQQKAMEEMRASGSMDREAMMAKRKELADARDAKLKAIFTEVQMKKWKDEIEPSLRPQRGNAPRPQ